MNGADTLKTGSSGTSNLGRSNRRTVAQSVFLVALMVFSTLTAIDFVTEEVSAASDLDGDGLTYGLEYLINTAATDWDSDNDGLPDGWEWKYGLDPLSATGGDGAVGDPDGDGMSNLQEYSYLQPSNWDNPATTGVLDNGVWWNGTIPVNDWNEEDSMQFNQPKCGDTGSDGQGNTILCDEDPVGNVCANGFDDDKDGQVDGSDSDNDGTDCSSDDDDGDGIADEDPNGWDTDGDGMPDGWEAANGLNATSASNADGANGDPDGDGLINLMEYVNLHGPRTVVVSLVSDKVQMAFLPKQFLHVTQFKALALVHVPHSQQKSMALHRQTHKIATRTTMVSTTRMRL